MKKKRTNSWIKWTHTEIARLRQLVDDGNLTIAEIAADLGRAVNGVADKKLRLGLCTPRRLATYCPKTLAGIIKFKMAGWNLTEIAKVYGVKQARISGILCANGFKHFLWIRPQRTQPLRLWSELEDDRLQASLKKGDSLDHICTLFPLRSRGAIQKRVWRMTRDSLSPEQRTARKTEIGRILKKTRLAHGLSMRKMAAKLKLSEFYPNGGEKSLTSMVYFWEVGTCKPRGAILQRYADIFEISALGFLPKTPQTYYVCTQRDAFGMPLVVESRHYDEKGNCVGVEKQEGIGC